MTFSVIIPSYGQAQYLDEAIQSALSQNFDPNDYEVIVVDDGSTDGSLDIAKKYAPRVKVIRQINKGLAAARNTGIMNAGGDYIVPLDADDRLLPNALQVMSTFIASTDYWTQIYKWDCTTPTLTEPFSVIAASIRCVDETGKTHDTILMESPKVEDFKEGNRLAYCAAIKRSTLLEVGGYSTRYDALGGWEDLALWYDLMGRGLAIKTIQEPLLIYRVKENSMWKDAEKNKAALWAQIVKDFPQAKDHVRS